MRSLALLSAFLALPMLGCGSDAHYRTARVLYTATDVADVLVEHEIDSVCRDGCHELDVACRQRCDEQIARFEPAVRAVEVARRMVLAAIGALLAAEEDGDDPPGLRERLACAAGSLILVADALRVAELELPEAVELGIEAVIRFGGVARSSAVGECRGLDDQAAPDAGQRGETSAPTRDAGTWTPAGPATGAGGARRTTRVRLSAALESIGGA